VANRPPRSPADSGRANLEDAVLELLELGWSEDDILDEAQTVIDDYMEEQDG
jgi:hypothetical protein